MKSKKISVEESMADTANSREEQIRRRAYELYLARNGGPGNELEDWVQAEAEIAWKLNH